MYLADAEAVDFAFGDDESASAAAPEVLSVEFGRVKVSAPPEFFVSCPVVTGGSAVFIVVGGDLDGFTFGGGTAAIVVEFAGFGG